MLFAVWLPRTRLLSGKVYTVQVFVMTIFCCCCFLPPTLKVIGFHGVWLNTELTEINQEARAALKREDPDKMCKNLGENS